VRVVLLGTGTSFGVPQVGCHCRTCTSSDPRDRRTRTAALVDASPSGGRLLIDTPPELRLQLVAHEVDHVDAVLYTHAHADHVHGIDDLRGLSIHSPEGLRAYGPADALADLVSRFGYAFDAAPPRPGTSKPRLVPAPVAAFDPVEIAGITVLPLPLPHGGMTVFGYRIGPIAYLTDAKAVPEAVRTRLAGVEVLVLNALLARPHPLHLSIPEAIATAQAIGAPRTLLTHLTHATPHAELAASLPAGIEPAFDGQVVDV
jgi:phosphoribosyl 1,2-cyclic phosphate phosphodiesterase